MISSLPCMITVPQSKLAEYGAPGVSNLEPHALYYAARYVEDLIAAARHEERAKIAQDLADPEHV